MKNWHQRLLNSILSSYYVIKSDITKPQTEIQQGADCQTQENVTSRIHLDVWHDVNATVSQVS
jgi:hypothetical protein